MVTKTDMMISATDYLADTPKNVAAMTPAELATELDRITTTYHGFMFGRQRRSERADERMYSLVRYLYGNANRQSLTPYMFTPVFWYGLIGPGADVTYLVLIDTAGTFTSSQLAWYFVKGLDGAKSFDHVLATHEKLEALAGSMESGMSSFARDITQRIMETMLEGLHAAQKNASWASIAYSEMVVRAHKLHDLNEELQHRERGCTGMMNW